MMKDQRTFAKAVEELRNARRENKAQLARTLGVRPATISEWEASGRGYRPSAETCLKLARLAAGPAARSWFLSQAGMDDQMVLSLAQTIKKDRRVEPGEVEAVRLRPLPGTRDRGEVFMPVHPSANPDFTYYFEADSNAADFILAPGTVAVDTQDGGSLIAPFWKSIVLIHIDQETSEGWMENPYTDYLLGQITLLANPDTGGRLPGLAALAKLGGVGLESRLRPMTIGSFFHPDYRDAGFCERVKRGDRSARRALEQAAKTAEKEMHTYPGIRVVGRAVGWQPSLESNEQT